MTNASLLTCDTLLHMSSTCNNSVLLDAAKQCVLDTGWRRTTLSDIARRAGVSRMTLYRTFPDMEALLRELMVREWSDVGLPDDAAALTPSGLAAAMMDAVEGLRTDPLFRKMVDVDPEMLLPYLLRAGRTHQVWFNPA